MREFSEAEAEMGVRYARSVFGFTIDKEYLRKSATLALEKLKRNPQMRLCHVSGEVLGGINFTERRAYVKAIAKMLGERSVSHSHRKVAVT
ncbi:hypothetical protein KGQ72_01265 [Patescibacteria group bacterium]|nr:hypothetical protein [Patescibacteria group bacterium]